MSQVITNAFEQYWQSSLAAEQPVVLDEFILADIPNLDITSPIDPATGLPPESQIVHRQNVDQRGRINNNAVAYTIVMDTTVGDFSFNAMYLRNKQNGVIGMIVYKGRETKLKTDQTTGQTGNSLVKSMLMGYDQAAEATLTNVDAGTWQIDYAARLRGMDEDIRQLQADLYGHHTFVGDGFKVVEQDGAYQVSQGVAIIGGLRIELKQPQVIYPGTKPIGVWVDVHRSGSLLSEHQNHFTIITSVADLTDHVDESGYPHYVAKLATVLADGAIEDGRGSAGGGSGGAGSIPDTFALWKRSMAEAGYNLIGQFGTELTIETSDQAVLSKDGSEVFTWVGVLPKKVTANDSHVGDVLWVSRTDELLSKKLSSIQSGKGSSLVGDHVEGTVADALARARANNREALCMAYAAEGWTIRPEPESLENGGTLTSASDVILHLATGIGYSASGPFPKKVEKNSDPITGGYTARNLVQQANVSDYASLRLYTGTAVMVNVLGVGDKLTAGLFAADLDDTTSEDNVGTIVVSISGVRWKRIYSGPAKVSWFMPDTPSSLQAVFNLHIDLDFDIIFTSNATLTFYSNVTGMGQVIAAQGVMMDGLVSAGTDNVRWDVDIDMAQTANTTNTDQRCTKGLYIANKNGIRGKFKVLNVRYGRPVYITATSGNSTAGDGSHDPIAGEGSSNIRIDYDCVAFKSPEVDDGCYSVVRSDFYSTVQADLHDGSNARKRFDLTIDTTKAYQQTTRDVWLSGSWVNHDRVAVLNAREVFINEYYARDFKTRGFNFSPSCEDCHVGIGKVSGHAANVNFSFSKACTAGGFSIEATGSEGQKLSLKAVASEDIDFFSITGRGGLNGTLEFSGSKSITFRDIKAKKAINPTSGADQTLYALYYDGNYADNFVSSKIVIDGCKIAANKILQADNITPTSKIGIGGVKVRNTFIENSSALFAAPLPAELYGMFDFEGVSWNTAPSSGVLPEFFSNYRNNAEPMNFMDKVTMAPVSNMFIDFPSLYFYASVGGSDATRMPNILLFKDGAPLVFNIDWFMDGQGGSSGTYGKMVKRIRLKTATTESATYVLQRLA